MAMLLKDGYSERRKEKKASIAGKKRERETVSVRQSTKLK